MMFLHWKSVTCAFLIDNADGVIPAVQKQIDSVRKYAIKAICYFFLQNESEDGKCPLRMFFFSIT